jgi:hypothetical protein
VQQCVVSLINFEHVESRWFHRRDCADGMSVYQEEKAFSMRHTTVYKCID